VLLGVDVIPQAALVVQHTRELCLSLYAQGKQFFVSTSKVNALREVLLKIYGFLKSCTLDDDLIATLSDTPCVCVPESLQLIRPRQFATDLTDETEIKPFLNRLPFDLGQFVELFYRLGTKKKPTIQQYARVLTDVHVSAQDRLLSESERKIALDAMRYLFILLDKDSRASFLNNSLFSRFVGKTQAVV
jgi:hypothetical protein